jgi:hypothetical protein
MREIMRPRGRKEFNRSISAVVVDEFSAAAEDFIEEVRHAAADL